MLHLDPNLAYDIVVQRNARDVARATQPYRNAPQPRRRPPITVGLALVAALAQLLRVQL